MRDWPGVHIHPVRHVIRHPQQELLSTGPQGWCSLRVAALQQDLVQPEQDRGAVSHDRVDVVAMGV
eukprot:9361771-Alexandrium_andersonii.AAC.1